MDNLLAKVDSLAPVIIVEIRDVYPSLDVVIAMSSSYMIL